MKRGNGQLLVAAVLLGGGSYVSAAGPVLSTGTFAPGSTSYNDAGAGGYNQASSIQPGAGDIAVGSASYSTNYTGTFEASGGNSLVLVDGKTAVDPSNNSEPTSGGNSAFDLQSAHEPWYAAFTLPASSTGAGWDISSTQVITGHQDGRLNQQYDILVSSDGTNFYSLSDTSGNAYALAGATGSATGGPGFSYGPSNGHGGAAQSTVTPGDGPLLATGVNYFEFVDLSQGADVYREVALYGSATPTPEPASVSLLALGAIGLLARRRRR